MYIIIYKHTYTHSYVYAIHTHVCSKFWHSIDGPFRYLKLRYCSI